ncbi:MAG: acyl-CoA dehydrogenase [Thermodesulfobacteriota bacterium]|nr:acyl-CoA dehydrogenase [Thermodesulfobacteriota bacterium]
MATRFVSERNIRFLLYEVFDVDAMLGHEYYSQHNRKMIDMVIKAAVQLATDLLFPLFEEMDRKPPELVNGEVRVHPAMRKLISAYADGGWLTSRVPFDQDGEQLPHMVADVCEFIFSAANYSAYTYAGLTIGAAHLIEAFGDQALYDTYVSHMRAGKWQGTMALTEPEAGSSLSDVATVAAPTDKGYYLIKGQKVFISAGDHDAVDNVVHLMLARIDGAPAGVKGISLFVVPKKRPGTDGGLEANDVTTSGIYHKLGYRGCPIAQLSMGDRDDCRGWLVGEPHNGLRYMFQMMNEARIGVGMGATAMASGAYYATLEYARTRRQGRKPGQKDPLSPPVAIIEHADIRRMLLFQRSVVEGALSLLMQCSKYVDYQKVLDGEEQEKYHLLLEILTPVAKSYPSEMGNLAISNGLQCLGGSGYCDDYPLEQYYRDCRIHPIHEGTTGIQGMDLLGRKVIMQEGRAFAYYIEAVRKTIADAGAQNGLADFADRLSAALDRLQEVTRHLMSVARLQGADVFLADATLYLEYFGIITIAWQWLRQGIAVQRALDAGPGKKDHHFYYGKMATLRYFFAYELPKTEGLAIRLTDDDRLTVEMVSEDFND